MSNATQTTAHTSRTAIATPTDIDGTFFDVTYVGSRDMDAKVGYDYLRALARRGYTVRVEACPAAAAHVISPES